MVILSNDEGEFLLKRENSLIRRKSQMEEFSTKREPNVWNNISLVLELFCSRSWNISIWRESLFRWRGRDTFDLWGITLLSCLFSLNLLSAEVLPLTYGNRKYELLL